MKQLLQKYKYYIFPILVIIVVIILSLLRLNGSSVAMYNKFLNLEIKNDQNLLLGVPRAVRSDQYIGGIPTYSSQNLNNETTLNTDIGEGMRMETQNLPTKTLFSIFRPTHFFFYLSSDTELSYSFYWWAEMGLMIICIYLLLLEITNKNLLISILGSSILFLSPFFHWWNQFNCITWLSLGIYFFLKIIKSTKVSRILLYGMGFTYSLISFALILYPPFQVPLAYIALAVGLAGIFSNWDNIKNNWKVILPTNILSFTVTIIVLLFFFKSFTDVIEITQNTVYPGARFVSAGNGSLAHLFNGFYNILLQKDSNIAPFGNQSESANFFLLFPPLIIWILYKNICNYIKSKSVDVLGLLLSLSIIFLLLFYLIPLPDFLSKYSLLFMVPPQRYFIGIAFANYILLFHTLSSQEIYKAGKNKIDIFLALLLSILFGLFMYLIGKSLFEVSPNFFQSPTFIPPLVKMVLVGFLSLFLSLFTIIGNKKTVLVVLLFYSLSSSVFINPLYKGLGPLLKTDLAEYIQEVSQEDNSKWVGYNSLALSQYALANGASMINGMHTYPQFKIWGEIDNKNEYKDIYNRFAYVLVSEKSKDEQTVVMIAPDTVEINMDTCDITWKSLDVKYIISNGEINKSCIELKKGFSDYNVYIYELR